MRDACGIIVVAALAATLAAACSRAPEPRRYEVRGQILSLDPEREEVLVNHEDIEGFMPAMTMPYKVQDRALLEGKQPGDLFTATLVVEEVNAYLTTLTTTGRAPLETPPPGPSITATDLLEAGEDVPDHALVDQGGTARPLTSFRGHRVALTFIYTRCPVPDFCPLMDKHFAAVQQQVKAARDLSDVRLVSVTLDPAFDTPAVLTSHARRVGADTRVWSFLTGDPAEVLAVAKAFGVITEPGASADIVVHNLRTAVIDPEGRVVTVHSGNMWTPAELVANLKAAPAPTR
jgi:protein SCO1/2